MLIPKQTAAATEVKYFTRGSLPCSAQGVGDFGSYAIAVNVMDEEGVVKPLYDENGDAVFITETSRPLGIDKPITLQFVKPVTFSACGIQINY